jgi:hypothetical protein
VWVVVGEKEEEDEVLLMLDEVKIECNVFSVFPAQE